MRVASFYTGVNVMEIFKKNSIKFLSREVMSEQTLAAVLAAVTVHYLNL